VQKPCLSMQLVAVVPCTVPCGDFVTISCATKLLDRIADVTLV